jgi:hypothetical protein
MNGAPSKMKTEKTLPVKNENRAKVIGEVGLILNPPSTRPLVNLKRVQFKLVRGVEGKLYHWTVHLPTQIAKFVSKDEAKKNLAITIDRIMSGRFDVLEIDLTEGRERTMVGGYKHLRQLVNTRYGSKKKKRKSRKKKAKVIVHKRNLYANLSRACLGRRQKPKQKKQNRRKQYAKGRVR